MDYQGQYAQALQSLFNQLQDQSAGGSVDLTNRPRVTPEQMAEGGYPSFDGDFARTFANTYNTYQPNGEAAAGNFTPVQGIGGNASGVMNYRDMDEYARGVLAGEHPDYLGLQIGGTYSGNDAVNNASADNYRQRELERSYYALLDRYLGR